MSLSIFRKSFWLTHPWRLLALLILVAAAAWGLTFFKQDSAQPIYVTEAVKRGDIENLVTATGSLQPRDYVDVGAQVSGQLKKLHVDIGSQVKKGDLLAEIDATVYAAKVDETRAQLANQKALLLDRQAQLQLANIKYQRQLNLAKDDATTEEAVQIAESSFKSAKAQVSALQAQIQQTDSALRIEAANLDFANIYAPMDGTVVTLEARQGQTLNANQVAPIIMRIADLSIMTVQTQVSEADIGKLRAGMEVYFTTLGGQDRRWYSKLDRIQPTPEVTNNVVLYNALFEVPNAEHLLMTQMSTQVFFIVSQAKNALVVPMSAVHFAPEKGDWKKDKTAKNNRDATANLKEQTDKKIAKAEAHLSAQENGQRNQDKKAKHGEPKLNADTRRAMVKVMTPEKIIEQRKVLIGVTSRVEAEVIDGLQEGDLIVTSERNAKQSAAPAKGGWGGGPRMIR